MKRFTAHVRIGINQFEYKSVIKRTPLPYQQYSSRSIYIQRSPTFGSKQVSNNNYLRQRKQHIWIPPVWLRPLIRPLLVIIGSFLAGIILQIWKGQPPQWLLSETAAEGTSVSGAGIGQYAGRIIGGSVLCIALYVTRLRNPLYTSIIGATETNLCLAEGESKLPLNAKWDSRSANDSMKMRLASMEKYLGAALSTVEDGNVQKVQQRADKIRQNGYNNAIKIALQRAEFWAEDGQIVKFEQTLQKLQAYQIEGGTLNEKELERIKEKAYGTHCSKLLAKAQTFSNKGDVSSTQKAITSIRETEYKLNGTFVEQEKLQNVLSRAHQYHVSYMLNEARNVRQNGSRAKAKKLIDQARQYANTNNVEFDENAAKQILN